MSHLEREVTAVLQAPLPHVSAVGARVSTFVASDERTLDVALGREIGYEFARIGVRLPEDSALALREGWSEGRQRYGDVQNVSTRWQRKLLRLRASAWRRNRLVDPQVTPDYIQALQVRYCPITHLELTSGTGTETDATIDRVFNGGAYAVGNLAVMSMKANRAKANLMPLEIVEIAKRGTDDEGLLAIEWMRLAALTSASAPPGYPQTQLPLLVYPPNGLLVSNGYVVLQQSFSALAVGWIKGKTVKDFRAACDGKKRKKAMDDFLIILTAVVGRETRGVTSPELYRFGICAAWATPAVFDKYIKFMGGMSKDEVMEMLGIARRAQDSLQSLDVKSLEAWSTETHGYAK